VWDEIQGSMSMILQLGNAGHPFGGADTPGFYGEPTDDLWVAFYQVGSYYPFFRAHTHIDYVNREPWLQSQRVQTAIRHSINRRYDLIHYIYTTFRYTTQSGVPLWRIMWNEFPEQDFFYDVASQFMLGDSLLIAPKVTKPTAQLSELEMTQVTFALPENHYWYHFDTKVKNTNLGAWQTHLLTDLEEAVFVKGGSVLPILQHADCMSLLPCMQNAVTLELFLDADDNAVGSLYVDDGETLSYLTDSESYVEIDFNMNAGTFRSSVVEGSAAALGADQKVTELNIYGYHSAPLFVLAGAIEVDFIYDADREGLYVDLSAHP